MVITLVTWTSLLSFVYGAEASYPSHVDEIQTEDDWLLQVYYMEYMGLSAIQTAVHLLPMAVAGALSHALFALPAERVPTRVILGEWQSNLSSLIGKLMELLRS